MGEYNQLNAGELPETGADALNIGVWRHSIPLNRDNGFILSTTTSSYLVTHLLHQILKLRLMSPQISNAQFTIQ